MLENTEKPETSDVEKLAKFAAETNVEDAEIRAYMDPANQEGEAPTEEERVAYLERRYQETKEEYRRLSLERDEIEGLKRTDLEPGLQSLCKRNYIARKYFVLELRKVGRPVKDKWVPG